jgi:hypothetical protein
MSSCDNNATDPMDNHLGNRLKNWAAQVQPRPVVRRLVLEAASRADSGPALQQRSQASSLVRRFNALSVSLVERLASQGLPEEMSSAVGGFHRSARKYERDIVLHSFPTGMGIYMLMA